MEDKLEAFLKKSLDKISNMVESIIANQKDIKGSASALSEATETLQTITQDLGNSTKEASATSNQLTTTVTSY